MGKVLLAARKYLPRAGIMASSANIYGKYRLSIAVSISLVRACPALRRDTITLAHFFAGDGERGVAQKSSGTCFGRAPGLPVRVNRTFTKMAA
jgi:hypothetical protein